MKKFVAILNIPSPYRVYLLEKLQTQLEEKGYQLEVHFMAKGHPERPKSWLNPVMSFPYKYHLDIGYHGHHLNPGLIASLLFRKPEVLLVGTPFDTFTGQLAALFLRAKIKCCWVEGQTKTPGKLDGPLGAIKRIVLSRFDYVAVPGRDAAGYIALHQQRTRLKMPKPVYFPNLIDESRFRPRSEWPVESIATCRSSWGVKEDEEVCLIPARLDKVKGLVPFVQALDAEQIKNGWRIVIMGQGSEREELLATAQEKGIVDRVTILDYIPYDQMPVCYAAADLMLLPSLHDPNPLSVPEALHSGLPIALSDQAGNVEEGVADGCNGWRLPVTDSEKFRVTLREVFGSSPEDLRMKGRRSLEENAKFWHTTEAIGSYLREVGV